MGNPTGFLQFSRRQAGRRPVEQRVRDYLEVYLPMAVETAREQGARCMDCAVPFCHDGCPLGNLIPEWNDLVYRDDWEDAIFRLHLTNNFPEFTGRLCPAPCEPACVLAINDEPVTIKHIENEIVERAFSEGWVTAEPPSHRTQRRVAVIGSGPAGLAAAQQLNRAGHWVTVFDRSDRAGGLLRYGIPDFKMAKVLIDRRLDLLCAEGIAFETNCDVGADIGAGDLRERFDAVILAIGSERARDVQLPGRELEGIHLAMDYLVQQNRRVAGDVIAGQPLVSAAGRDVVIIGGGDTAADCLGNAHRERCASVRQLVLYPELPADRAESNPWPELPLVLQTTPAHEEGGSRTFSIQVTGFGGDRGRVERVHAVEVEFLGLRDNRPRFEPITNSEFTLDTDLVLLSIGFTGPADDDLLRGLEVTRDHRGNIAVDGDLATSVPGVFAAGDASRGASLIVWAIADGRRAAHSCDAYLRGTTSH